MVKPILKIPRVVKFYHTTPVLQPVCRLRRHFFCILPCKLPFLPHGSRKIPQVLPQKHPSGQGMRRACAWRWEGARPQGVRIAGGDLCRQAEAPTDAAAETRRATSGDFKFRFPVQSSTTHKGSWSEQGHGAFIVFFFEKNAAGPIFHNFNFI